MNLNLRCSNQVVEDRHLEALQKVCEGRFSTGRREESVAMMCSYRKSSRYIYIYIYTYFFFWGVCVGILLPLFCSYVYIQKMHLFQPFLCVPGCILTLGHAC